METTNVVVNDFNDFSGFYKEDEITNFTKEAMKEFGADQNVATPEKNGVDDNVATTGNLKEKEAESASAVIFND